MESQTTGMKRDGEMVPLAGEGNSYRTAQRKVSMVSRLFPSCAFYSQGLTTMWKDSMRAKRGDYDDYEWYQGSLRILKTLESVGVQVEVSGLEHLRSLSSPCVIVGNHMSMLETLVLPGIVRAFMPVTFVVKDSLLTFPVFCHLMRSRDPVAVTRKNPREDFATVMKGGKERLEKGTSIVVFPQTTRTATFQPKKFNSIGIKLAQRARVPVVPLALLTDTWANGKILKDYGRIDVTRKVHFEFGKPIEVGKSGADANQAVIGFIQDRLAVWRDSGV